MGRDLGELLRKTAPQPQRPVDPQRINTVARRRTWRDRLVLATAIAALVAGLVSVVPGLLREPSTPEIVDQPEAIPVGWQTVRVADAAFSVPGDWPVHTVVDPPGGLAGISCATEPGRLATGPTRVRVAPRLLQKCGPPPKTPQTPPREDWQVTVLAFPASANPDEVDHIVENGEPFDTSGVSGYVDETDDYRYYVFPELDAAIYVVWPPDPELADRIVATVRPAGDTSGTPSVTRSPTPQGSPSRASASPDGGHAVAGAPDTFVGVQDGRVAVFDASSGDNLRWLTDPPDGRLDAQPVLAAAAERVFFVRGEPVQDSPEVVGRQILSIGTDGSTLRTEIDSMDEVDNLGVSDDASKLAFTTSGQGDPGLVVVDRSLGQRHEVDMPDGGMQISGRPAWSPDGRRLAFFYLGGGGVAYGVHVLDDVWTAQATDEARPLKGPSCFQTNPNWRPDATLVVLTCADETEGEVAAVAFDPATGEPLGELFRFAVPDGTAGGPSAQAVQRLDLSPAGDAAVYDLPMIDGNHRVFVWRADEPRRLDTNATSPTW